MKWPLSHRDPIFLNLSKQEGEAFHSACQAGRSPDRPGMDRPSRTQSLRVRDILDSLSLIKRERGLQMLLYRIRFSTQYPTQHSFGTSAAPYPRALSSKLNGMTLLQLQLQPQFASAFSFNRRSSQMIMS